jgi:DNA-binding transcriptional ArsR family regulator
MPIPHPLTAEAAELIARRFAALAEPMRLRILHMLREAGEASVQEITDALGSSQQNVSKHLGLLHAERIVARRKEKTRSLYRISDPGVLRICEEVCGGLEQRHEELGALLGGGAASAS